MGAGGRRGVTVTPAVIPLSCPSSWGGKGSGRKGQRGENSRNSARRRKDRVERSWSFPSRDEHQEVTA